MNLINVSLNIIIEFDRIFKFINLAFISSNFISLKQIKRECTLTHLFTMDIPLGHDHEHGEPIYYADCVPDTRRLHVLRVGAVLTRLSHLPGGEE